MKMKTIFIFPLFTAITFSANSSPLISEIVLATETNNSIITINGSGFGAGPNVVLFDTFTRGTEGSPVDLEGAEVSGWSSNGIWAGVAKFKTGLNGNIGYSVRDKNYSTSGMDRHAQLEKIFDSNYQEILISFDVLVPEGNLFSGANEDYVFPSRSTWKFSWLLDGKNASGAEGFYDMCIPTHVGSGNIYIAGNDGNLTYADHASNWWSWHDYNTITFWQKADPKDPLGTGGKFLWQTVNKDKGYREKSNNQASIFKSGVTTTFDRIRFPGWFGNADQTKFDAIYDNIYIAVGENSQARIEIGNSETYSKSTELTIYPPVSWQTNTIQLKAYNFNPEKQYYAYVTDASGNRNEKGFAICSKCPIAPLITID